MNNLQKIEQLEKELAALKSEIVNEPMFPIPESGQTYYYTTRRFSVDYEDYEGFTYEKKAVEANNAFTDKEQAQACADYLKNNFWFIRKAIEFSDGYKFKRGYINYYVYYSCGQWEKASTASVVSANIFMTGLNAIAFCEWLNKHKPNGFN